MIVKLPYTKNHPDCDTSDWMRDRHWDDVFSAGFCKRCGGRVEHHGRGYSFAFEPNEEEIIDIAYAVDKESQETEVIV